MTGHRAKVDGRQTWKGSATSLATRKLEDLGLLGGGVEAKTRMDELNEKEEGRMDERMATQLK